MKLSVLEFADDLDTNFREHIRAEGLELPKYFSKILDKVVSEKNITKQEFAKSLGYSNKQVRIWREGKAAIPLIVLVKVWKLGNQSLDDLEQRIEYVRVYGGQNLKVPRELTLLIAEFAGRHCGDGSCSVTPNKDYRVTLTETWSLINTHNMQIKEIFGIEPSVERINDSIGKSIVNSKVYCRFFTKILGISSGKKTSIVKEPEIIKHAGLEFRKSFVKGLVDTEGCLYFDKAKKQWILEIHMINQFLIKTIEDVLRKSNFNPIVLKKKKSYSLRLVGKDKIKRYFMTFGTSNGKYKLEF